MFSKMEKILACGNHTHGTDVVDSSSAEDHLDRLLSLEEKDYYAWFGLQLNIIKE